MVEYKVVGWNINIGTREELENELNKNAEEGWRIKEVIKNTKGFNYVFVGGIDSNEVVFILEREVE